MDWSSDLEIASKKLIPRLGRRAAQNNGNEDARSDDDVLDSPGSFSSGVSGRQTTVPVAPPRTRKTGWGDELKGGKTKVSNIIEQERFGARENDEADDEIPVIPDLDEIQVDAGMAEITNVAPMGINRVAAYKELDKDLLKNEAFAFLDGVNLAILTDKLYPDKLVREPDEMWSWDLLFTQISSELNSEAQKKLDS